MLLIDNISDHYERHLQSCNTYLNFLEEELLPRLKYNVYTENKKRGVIRTNSYYKSQTPYKRELTINDFKNYEHNQKAVINLLRKDAPEEYQKLLNDKENIHEIGVSIIVGKRLSKYASIALKGFTALIYREYHTGKIESLSCKVTIKASDFWKLCNIKKTTHGYDYRSKEAIKTVIQEELRRDIFYEDKKSFYITSFLLNFHWVDNNTFTFQIEDMFLVHKDSQELSYYYSDLEGCNRLMNKTNHSDSAYWLHHYLEHAIKSDHQPFNFQVLLEKAMLEKRYITAKTRIRKLLYTILDAMVSEHTLIYKWDLIPSSSDSEGKFVLYNLRTKGKIIDIKTKLKPNKKPRKKKK